MAETERREETLVPFPLTILVPFWATCLILLARISLTISQLDTYLQLKGTQLEREMAAEIILRILDKVMQNAQSLNSQQVRPKKKKDQKKISTTKLY